ncbi:hypothetical protein SK128_021336 [Halocaridina rubra]|uniref:NACHT domain-containing protein n=1 Tax=Halocaridina rubra TaxID=373956 RepID=A0AAN8ZTF5_HALRR
MAEYGPEDAYLFRLRKMTSYVSSKVLLRIFQEGTKSKKKHEPLFQYYSKKNIEVRKFKKCLDNTQIKKIELDPTGRSFDVTLLFKCIKWGNDKLRDKNSDAWKEGNESLESHSTAIKNKRNAIFHDDIPLDKTTFLYKTEELRKTLIATLTVASKEEYYGISDEESTKLITEVNEDINCLRDKPLIPMNFEDYKRQNYFIEQGDYVRNEGTIYLRAQYEKIDIVTPGVLLLKMSFKAKDIYVDMVLTDYTNLEKEEAMKFEDLLTDITLNTHDQVLLIEGFAGVGKTTLTKKILCDWASGQSNMTNLMNYDLLLYAECRNNSIRDFKALVSSLMPNIASSFKEDDFKYTVLDQKLIVVIDGLDELNTASAELFNEVLKLKQTYGLTLIVTTRPERVNTYYIKVSPLNIRTKHIRLKGISKDKVHTFVIQYHKEMKKNGIGPSNINSLLDYLTKTAQRLMDLWMLPFNLILLIILWTLDPRAINNINTASELFWKIQELILLKLKERLQQNENTRHMSEPLLENKIQIFMNKLYSLALRGLANDEINLSDRSYKELEQICIQESIPSDDMIGAFLKKVLIGTPQGFESQHSFPHKGFQEFFGAKKIFLDILSMPEKPKLNDTLQDIDRALMKHKLPSEVTQALLAMIERKVSKYAPTDIEPTYIRDILDTISSSQTTDIRKYQNLLITLIGMFYLEKNTNDIAEFIKYEALHLLEESGIRDREAWLRVLNTVKCDKFVATYISAKQKILDGVIKVNDTNLFAYVSLLKVLTSSSYKVDEVKFEIQIRNEPVGVEDLIKQLHAMNLQVTKLELWQDFYNPKPTVKLEADIVSVQKRCQLESYIGALTPKMELPMTIKSILISLSDAKCIAHLNSFLQSSNTLTELGEYA